MVDYKPTPAPAGYVQPPDSSAVFSAAGRFGAKRPVEELDSRRHPMNKLIPALAGFLVLLQATSGAGDDTGFAVTAGVRQLFLDDDGIQSRENLRTNMHRPVKHGAVLRSPDPSRTLQTRTAPVWDPTAQALCALGSEHRAERLGEPRRSELVGRGHHQYPDRYGRPRPQ